MELVERVWEEARQKVWAAYPEHKAIQLKLEASGNIIDNYLIRWDPMEQFEKGVEPVKNELAERKMEEATQEVWAADPELKARQLELKAMGFYY